MKTVLIVDDSNTIRRLLQRALQGADYLVLEASNGEEALAYLKVSPPDVIIADVHMPKIDGIALVQQVRAIPSFANLPILLLTTEEDEHYKQRARSAGATAWLRKPFEDLVLRDAVSRVLENPSSPGATKG